MTLEIAAVLLIIGLATVLFVSDKLRVDLVALLVLGSLVLTRIVSPTEALAGFSNAAVITVWAMFIISGGLTRTGVANYIGQQVMRLAGNGEIRLTLLIMSTAAVLSAFMNNVGVAALMLPVVVDIARQTNRSPSRLLMPLAFGSLLGGLTTLIGTPPNILASDALVESGLAPFELFDFMPVGFVVMLAGIMFMVFVGRHLLPPDTGTNHSISRDPSKLEHIYQIRSQLLLLRIPSDSMLTGLTLSASHLGSVLGLNVIAILNKGNTIFSPRPSQKLSTGDELLVMGDLDLLEDLRKHQVQTLERSPLTLERLRSINVNVVKAGLESDSHLIGKTIEQAELRPDYDLNVLAINRGELIIRSNLQLRELQIGDQLLLQGTMDSVSRLDGIPGLEVSEAVSSEIDELSERLLLVRIPHESSLAGKTLLRARLGEAFGLTVLSIVRDGESILLPKPSALIAPGDTLLIQGEEERISAIRGLEELEYDDSPPAIELLQSADVCLAEAVISPHTTLAGKTLDELHFREKYELNVLAIWRGGQIYRDGISEITLRFGDALLLYGTRDKVKVLGSEADFLILDQEAQIPVRKKKGPIAIGILVAVLAAVFFDWFPISISAVIGGTLMVLTGCLTMDEAHRFIEWPAVFLIAGMLPLGTAMQNSEAAIYLADAMVAMIGPFGPIAILAGLFVLSTVASQVMPNPAVIVLMAPIVISTSNTMGVSPHSYMMTIAIAASASFLSPVSHPANILVMGPGGYRFSNYVKVGLPLTVLVFLIVLFLVPQVWPL